MTALMACGHLTRKGVERESIGHTDCADCEHARDLYEITLELLSEGFVR